MFALARATGAAALLIGVGAKFVTFSPSLFNWSTKLSTSFDLPPNLRAFRVGAAAFLKIGNVLAYYLWISKICQILLDWRRSGFANSNRWLWHNRRTRNTSKSAAWNATAITRSTTSSSQRYTTFICLQSLALQFLCLFAHLLFCFTLLRLPNSQIHFLLMRIHFDECFDLSQIYTFTITKRNNFIECKNQVKCILTDVFFV